MLMYVIFRLVIARGQVVIPYESDQESSEWWFLLSRVDGNIGDANLI